MGNYRACAWCARIRPSPWRFKVGGKFATKTTVNGRVRLLNLDEAALKVASRQAVRRIPIGKLIVVGHGNYVIMMAGQASDENYLTLVVR